MTFNIHDFKANGLQFGGARPSLFTVTLTPPVGLDIGGGLASDRQTFLIKAGSIPPAIIDSIDVYYFGRHVKYNGDRTFPDWDVTIMNDEDYSIRRTLEAWSNQINSHIANEQTGSAFNGLAYKSTAIVTQYGKAGTALAAYEFQGIWPKMVDQMDLDWAQKNTIQEYKVSFAYDLWVPTVADGGDSDGNVPPASTFTGLEQ